MGFTPQGQDFYYSFADGEKGWDGICTQEIIDECCDENVTTYENCPDVDPADIPYEDYPYWQLEAMGYDLVGACAQGDCDYPGYCRPLLEWDAAKMDWYFSQCICLEPSDMDCYGQTTETECERHFCVGEYGEQAGFAKRCQWEGMNGQSVCWCPFDSFPL